MMANTCVSMALRAADVGGQRRDAGIGRHLVPLPLVAPQIGGVHAVGTGQFQQRAVLRKQCQRRQALARQLAAEVVEHAEGGRFDGLDRRRGQRLGFGDEALYGAFAGAQHPRGAMQADHFQSAHALVQLGPRRTQHRRVDRVDVRAARASISFR